MRTLPAIVSIGIGAFALAVTPSGSTEAAGIHSALSTLSLQSDVIKVQDSQKGKGQSQGPSGQSQGPSGQSKSFSGQPQGPSGQSKSFSGQSQGPSGQSKGAVKPAPRQIKVAPKPAQQQFKVAPKPTLKVAPKPVQQRWVAPNRAPRYPGWSLDRRFRYYGAYFLVPFGFATYANHYCYDWILGPYGPGYYWNYDRCPVW